MMRCCLHICIFVAFWTPFTWKPLPKPSSLASRPSSDIVWRPARQELQLRHFSSNAPCLKCKANVTDLPWTDPSPNAACFATTWGAAAWKAAHPSAHHVFSIPGVNIHSVQYDLMHCKYLGSDMYIAGSVLHMLCYDMLPGRPKENMSRVLARLKKHWKDTNTVDHFNNIKLSMFCNVEKPRDNFPKLKGRAAEVKSLTPALHEVWKFFMVPTNAQHKQIELLLRTSMNIDAILKEYTRENKFPVEVYNEWQAAFFGYLGLQTALAKHYNGRGRYLFDVTFKSHANSHIAKDAEHLNPRRGWCYAGEHFQKVVKDITSSSCKGNKANAVSQKTNQKYSRGMHLEMRSA